LPVFEINEKRDQRSLRSIVDRALRHPLELSTFYPGFILNMRVLFRGGSGDVTTVTVRCRNSWSRELEMPKFLFGFSGV